MWGGAFASGLTFCHCQYHHAHSLPRRISLISSSPPIWISLTGDIIYMGDSSSTRLQVIFEAALEGYERQTGMKLIDHPLARQLENCNSIQSITAVLEEQARAFSQFRGDDGKVMKSLKCSVHILHGLSSSALGEGISLVRFMDFLGIF